MRYFVKLETGEELPVDVLHLPTGGSRIEVEGEVLDVDCLRADGGWSVRVGARVWDLSIEDVGSDLYVAASGTRLRGQVQSEQARLAAATAPPTAAGGVVAAPMPGRVVKILVTVGEPVKAGQPVAVVEAMKMENELCAETEGTVQEVLVEPGLNVEGGAALVRIAAGSAAA